jgi:hypothetical protein
MKKLVRFLENPKVYKTGALLLLLGFLYMALIDPLIRGRPAGRPGMLDAWIMRGK